MNSIFLDSSCDDASRRRLLFDGQLLAYSPRRSSLALVEFSRGLIREAFGELDPEEAQHQLEVERYVEILAALKPTFINHPTSKQLVAGILDELGCDLDKTYFDVPRMRTATSDAYLTSGLGYAFHPHRDTWYAAPMCQVNWWLPIYEIEPNNAMAFHCRYWSRPIANESAEFAYDDYVNNARKNAAQYVRQDTRKQPHPIEPVELDPQFRVITRVGGLLLFSAAQLHSTVPNTSGRTRFSIDFRTVHVDDVAARAGAANLDSHCTGTALRDFFRASDLAKLPEDLVRPFDSSPDGLGPET
jgi:hypothetical protein